MAKRTRLPLHNRRPHDNSSVITDVIVRDIIKYYRLGLKDSTIANLVGISPMTLRDWLLKGALGSEEKLHNELFAGSAKAVGHLELEFMAEIRSAAMGSPAVLAYDETFKPDGSIERKLRLDDDNKPIVVTEARPGNPQWAAWFLERRFRDTWGHKESNVKVEYTPDDIQKDTALLNNEQEKTAGIPVFMSQAEKLAMIDELKEKVLENESQEKTVNEPT